MGQRFERDAVLPSLISSFLESGRPSQVLSLQYQQQSESMLTKPQLRCPHCNFTSFMSQHMRSHVEAHERHAGQMYVCNICNVQFSQKANMHRHRQRHSGIKPFKCRFCDRSFFRKDQSQEHLMTHIRSGWDFDCPVEGCLQRFVHHHNLRTHIREEHEFSDLNPIKCKLCSMAFVSPKRLLLHYQTGHDEVVDAIKMEDRGDKPPRDHTPSTDSGFSIGSNFSMPFPDFTGDTPPSIIPDLKDAFPLLAAYFSNNGFPPPVFQENTPLFSQFFENLSSMMSMEQMPSEDRPTGEVLKEAFNSLNPPPPPAREPSGVPKPPVDVAPECETTPVPVPPPDAANLSPVTRAASEFLCRNNNSNASMECNYCGTTFTDSILFCIHYKMHMPSDPWRCSLCGEQCGNMYTFNAHLVCAPHAVSS